MIGCHCHTAKGSNLRLIDSTNKTKDLIKTAAKMGYSGIAITDHESLSAHVEAIKIVKELKKPDKNGNTVIPKDFKLLLGNEIYLLMEPLEEVKNNYKSGKTKFPHFILIAKDAIGHRQLRILTSKAWEQSFKTGIMERTPTEKEFLEQVVSENRGHLIASTACLGSEINIYLLEMKVAEENNDLETVKELKKKIHNFINWCINTFGKENFFIEIQPAWSEEQIYCNKKLIPIAKHYGLQWIVTTDAHFLRPEDREIHRAFLNSKDGEREVDDFYEACFLQNLEEIKERLNYLDSSDVQIAIENTLKIGDMVEEYDLFKPVSIPRIELPEFEVRHIFKPAYDKYEYIAKMAYSDEPQDRYLIKLIEDGFDAKVPRNTLTRESFHQKLARINIELEELWHISLSLKEAMSAYYITIREIVLIMWDDCGGNSLVGPGRGSAAGFYINYLLDITQVDPLQYNLPHWRHLHKSRPDYPDIDLDSEAAKRKQIINALKRKFGERKVINIATFGTEKSKSAVLTACRGLGYDNDIAMHIASLIPFERGSNWTISDCLYGNEEEEREPVKEFINEIEKYPKLKETVLKIEGLENKRSIHSGGVFIYNEDLIERNALMKAPNGQWITQFSMSDSEYMGGIKYDLLTVENEDKLRVSLNLLLENNMIEWQDSLKKTYEKYLHPDVLEYDNPEIWNKMGNGEVIDLFQFNTQIGVETAKKVKPQNVLEASIANSLMRLMPDEGSTQPVDLYVKYKNNISLWYKEMRDHHLTDDEISIMEKHLKHKYGIADSQESVMIMVMDEKISGFDIVEANLLRKGIVKKNKDKIEETRQLFYKKGRERGTSKHLLNYVWEVQIKRQIGYSFSDLHTTVYTIVGLQDLNLYHRYDPLIWNTACLTVNSASSEDENNDESDEGEEKKNKSTNYGKVASAIGMMQSHGVKIGLPDINKASFGFKPDFEVRQITYGLKGLVGVGDELASILVEHRPYKSFDDFLERMHDTGLVKKGQVLQLIKAGCFDSFGDRIEIMKHFITTRVYSPKDKLTMQNFNILIENNLIPEEYSLYKRLFKFRKYVTKKVYRTEGKDKLYLLDDISTEFYYEHFTTNGIVEYKDNLPVISEKIFKKEYDKKMDGIKEWLQSVDTLNMVNNHLYEIEWESNASGTISKWEMDSLSFYYTEHELKHINKEIYGIEDFNSLPEEPVVVSHYESRGQQKPRFKLCCIAGTVLDRDKNKHTIALLTTDGVVTVKYYDGAFAHYNKQVSRLNGDKKEILEKSWFTRGNKLVVYGYRRGSQFKPYKYFDSPVKHTTMLITQVNDDGTIIVKTEREI
ncbi:PHP domain-containing protein [Paenibacillus naphthalenovorans]|uniref:DNA-directed DNA polymerase n=1 Tax=Paenibacillus naphthalenovorans TaxID=162209 RepID=A0A0U2W3M5_9BACL|nr:PHP domain-containing protein [Paenibacillus naphthalenovorans]ALS22085.1 subunit alpha of DNA polymerase III [Paenibacillus naphthalenovorans]